MSCLQESRALLASDDVRPCVYVYFRKRRAVLPSGVRDSCGSDSFYRLSERIIPTPRFIPTSRFLIYLPYGKRHHQLAVRFQGR